MKWSSLRRSSFLAAVPALALALLAAGCGGGGGGDAGGGAESEEEVPIHERGSYLHVVLPSVVKAGEKTEVRLRVLTEPGIPDYDFEGAYRIEVSPPTVEFPRNLVAEPTQDGYFRIQDVVFPESGVHFLRGSVPGDTVVALANAFNVDENPEWNVYWGDLNGHSDLSTGLRAPAVYFWYASAVALLDFAALTDNDHEAALNKTLDDVTFSDLWEIVENEHREDGRFIPLLGMEWSSRAHGNRLVFFSEKPEKLPTVDAGFDTPAKLIAALPEGSVAALAHPSGSTLSPPADPAGVGGEAVVEIYSTLGSFEAAGSPRPTTQETPGAFVTDLLKRGLRFGLIGTSDTRMSTPGNPRSFVLTVDDHPWPGGLTAILAHELTRDSVLEALRARRCYATTGKRYLLEFTVDGQQMGSEIRVPRGHVAKVHAALGAVEKWIRMEIVGPNGAVESVSPEGPDSDVVQIEVDSPPVNEATFLYLRGMEETGGMAWSSPVFLIPE